MSKFDKVFEAREDQSQRKSVDPAGISGDVKNKSSRTTKQNRPSSAKTVSEQQAPGALEAPKPEKPRGRPKAKRSDPAFIGFTTYIRKDTHLKVKIALLQEGQGREMSELVEELLSNWTKNK